MWSPSMALFMIKYKIKELAKNIWRNEIFLFFKTLIFQGTFGIKTLNKKFSQKHLKK